MISENKIPDGLVPNVQGMGATDATFLIEKAATMRLKGGNTDELYKGDGRLKMAESLRDQHPDLCTITWKFNRWQHQVNYDVFKKNKLIRIKDLKLRNIINNYGMQLKEIKNVNK